MQSRISFILNLLCLLLAGGFEAHAAREGLVAEWSFDEGQGVVAEDSSGHRLHGRIEGARWVPGIRGTALEFNGTNSFVQVAHDSLLTPEAFTLELWFNPAHAKANATLIGKNGQDWRGYTAVLAEAKPQFRVFTPPAWNVLSTHYDTAPANASFTAASLQAVRNDRWIHLLCTYDGDASRLYVNGVLMQQTDSRLTHSEAPLVIGRNAWSGVPWSYGGYYAGTIDEVRLYDRAFAEAEVQRRYAAAAALIDLRDRLGGIEPAAARGRAQWVLRQLDRMVYEQDAMDEATAGMERLRIAIERPGPGIDVLPCLDVGTEDLVLVDDGRLGLGFRREAGRHVLFSLFDLDRGVEYFTGELPLWSFDYQQPDGAVRTVDSRHAALRTRLDVAGSPGGPRQVNLEWTSPPDGADDLIAFSAHCAMTLGEGVLSMDFVVTNRSRSGLTEVVFPQVGFREIGDSPADNVLVIPMSSGLLNPAPLQRIFSSSGIYPTYQRSLPMGAYYDARGGIYFASEDPHATTRDITFESNMQRLRYAVTYPVPGYGEPGTGFALNGQAVFRLFEGDWFDAAQIYKRWGEANIPEWSVPPRSPHPLREASVVMGWDLMHKAVEQSIKVAEELGVPIAVHLYNWYPTPFDNDNPHFFPARPEFREAVRTMQAAGISVMPYINVRSWDYRDRGAEDYQFSTRGLPNTAKDIQGDWYFDVTGSQETNGSIVKLAVMCPDTPLWQDTIRDVVLKLLDDYGVDGVYLDCLGAYLPVLCFDGGHGHPIGGGNLWAGGYREMLSTLRQEMARRGLEGKYLTGESNTEAYTGLVDGYLVNFQQVNQIPLFAAVHAGRTQIFGAMYGDDAAQRWRMGQQLVFGEQFAWLLPEDRTFLRKVARMRHALQPYIAYGEMRRPPALRGDLPQLTGDWLWGGGKRTVDAVMSGAWQAESGALALVFVNVSDTPARIEVDFDAAASALSPPLSPQGKWCLDAHVNDAPREPVVIPFASFTRVLQIPALATVAWELSPLDPAAEIPSGFAVDPDSRPLADRSTGTHPADYWFRTPRLRAAGDRGAGLIERGIQEELDLSDTDRFVDLGDIEQTAPSSLAVWVKGTTLTGDQRFFSHLTGSFDQGGSLRFENRELQVYDGIGTWHSLVKDLEPDTWLHLAVVYEADGKVTGYLNGVAQQTGVSPFAFDGVRAGLGAPWLGEWGNAYSGRIRNLRIFLHALSALEVEQIYQRGKQP